jgi:hypothetical protein
MNDEIEGIGEAVTGALAARAVEPSHGEEGGEGERLCANCSTELIGTHCHFCGQKAHIHRSIGAIAHDLVHGVLHLDGKFWRTLPLLLFRPGELTRRYAAGERAKFVSPLGMFLFAVFLMFAVLSIYGLSLTNLEFNAEEVSGAARGQVESELAAIRAGEPVPEAEQAQLPVVITADGEDREVQLERALEQIDAIEDGEVFRFFGDGFHTGWERLDHGIEKLNRNPGLALYKLQANGYKFSWLLIPLSVPFVWVLFFWTRRFHLYDHTVFVTYSLAFMSLFAVGLTVIGFTGLGGSWIGVAAVLVPPIHMYKQLKYGYRLTRFGALVRTVLLANFCFVTAMLFFVLLLGIGALG